jgi:Uma2 family endonuclease
MADLGWFNEQRVELIDGEIIDILMAGNPHCGGVGSTEDALRAAFGVGFWVRVQMPLDLGPLSEPQPDLAVIPGKPKDCKDQPTTALLVVEVSETTLSYDRHHKASLSARAGLSDYWIVNLFDEQLEVFRNPVADSAAPLGFRYADVTIHGLADVVSPLAAPSARIAVADLLP